MAYEKQIWETGDVITAAKMNHMEDGIADSGGSGGGASNIVNGSSDGSVRGIKTAEENESYTIGAYAFAEGWNTKASGSNSHAEGNATQATANNAHAEGNFAQATAMAAHAEGQGSIASGYYSHAEGLSTKATHKSQHVIGEFNKEDSSEAGAWARGTYAIIVGNGSSLNARSNAFAMKWDGTFVFANGTEITPAQFAQLLTLLN